MKAVVSTLVFVVALISGGAGSPGPEPSPSAASYCPPRPATKAQQRVIFEEAVQTLIIDRKFVEGATKFYDEGYIQHDPYVLSGRQNDINFLEMLDPSVNFTVINKGLDDNHAWAFQRVDEVGAEPLAWVDLWRFNGTCIMEHWDVSMARPADAINPLPMW